MSYYQDRNGRWHGEGGRFVSAATVAASGGGSSGGSSSGGGSRSSSGYSGYSGSGAGGSSYSGDSGSGAGGSGYSSFGSASRTGCSSPALSVSSSSSGLYKDRSGRWHGSDGKFVSHAVVASSGVLNASSGSTSRLSDSSGYSSSSSFSSSLAKVASSKPAAKSSSTSSVSSKSSSGSSFHQDQSGRWHGSDGKFVSKAVVASSGVLNASSGSTSRLSDSSGYSSVSSKSSSGSSFLQDQSGRWHGSDGKFVSKALVDSSLGVSSTSRPNQAASLNSSCTGLDRLFSPGITSTPTRKSPSTATSHRSSNTSALLSCGKESTSSSFYIDSKGRWHGPDGKFVARAVVDASMGADVPSSSRESSSNDSTSTSASKTTSANSSKLSTSSSFFKDSKGRWHGPDGKFVSKSAVDSFTGATSTSVSSTNQSLAGETTGKASLRKSSNSSKLSTSSKFYQDRNGRWHGPDGKFVSASLVGETTGKASLRKSSNSSKLFTSSKFYQDRNGRWHGPDGKFVSAAKVHGESEVCARPSKNWNLRTADEFQARSDMLERWLAHAMQMEMELPDAQQCAPPPQDFCVPCSRSQAEAEAPDSRSQVEDETADSEDQDNGLVIVDPSGVTWTLPGKGQRGNEDWTLTCPPFSLHGLQWELRLACRSGRCRLSLLGEAGEHRTGLGAGGWVCSQVAFAAALGSGAEVTRRLVRNPTGLVPGHAWMRAEVGAAPADSRALQVVHVALPPPTRGVAKDLLLLQDMEDGCDVTIKVAGGRLFPAHRAVLRCRSVVLAVLAEDGAGDAADGVLELQHLTARAARPFLQYVYGAVVPSDTDDTAATADLLCAALHYEVGGLAAAARAGLRQAVCSSDGVLAVLRALSGLPAPRLRAELDWLLASTSRDVLETSQWLDFMRDFMRDHPSQAMDVISALSALPQRAGPATLPGDGVPSGCVAACSDSGALWRCAPPSGSDSLASPVFHAAAAEWQLRWTAEHTISASRLTVVQDEDSEAESVTLLVLSEGSVLYETVPTAADEEAGVLRAALPGCPRPAGKPFAVYAHFHAPEQPQHHELLLEDLRRLLRDTPSMDVEVVSRLDAARPLRAHQAVLMARADVFKSMFCSGLQEQQERRVRLPFARDVLKSWIDFLYTDEVPEDGELLQQLQTFAKSYLLTELEEKCESLRCQQE